MPCVSRIAQHINKHACDGASEAWSRDGPHDCVSLYGLAQGSQTHLSMWAAVEDNSQSPQNAIVLRNTVLTAVES